MNSTENSVRLTRNEDYTLITLQGPLDHELARSIGHLIEKIKPPFIFDLRQVNYLTVAGSQLLLTLYQNTHIKPILRHIKPEIISLLKLSGTISYVTIADDATDITTSIR